MQLNSSSSDEFTVGGTQYQLSQFHYHDPAENQVAGTTYPMEEHFVGLSSSGAQAVVGVFLQLGAHNSAFDSILNAASNYLDNTPANTATPGSNVGTINFAGLLPGSLQGWFFQGSLTTPPLSQVVNWFVLSTPITIDAGQFAAYQKVANDDGFLPNARPVQPLDGRQLNEIDYNVDFQSQFTAPGLNFNLVSTSESAAIQAGEVNTRTRADESVQSQALPVLQGTGSHTSLRAAAAAQGIAPVAGCNCPVCQMLRNAVWHQVTQSGLQSAVSAMTAVSSNTTSASSAL